MKNLRKLLLVIITILSFSILPGQNASAQWQTISASTYNGLWFTDANTGYAVGNEGVIRKTTDGGSSWTILKSGIVRQLLGITFTSATTGYAVGISGTILKTTDSGVTWTSVNNSGVTTDLRAISFANANTLVAVGISGKIVRSTDGGDNWTSMTSGVAATVTLRAVKFHSSTTGYVVGTSGYVIKTTDAGATWTASTVGVASQLNAVWFIDDNTGHATSQGGIMYRTTNGGTSWTPINNTTSTPKSGTINALNSVWFTSSTKGYIVGTSGTIIKTSDAGASDWTSQTVTGLTVALNAVHFPESNTGYAAGVNGTILKTTDAGVTWNIITPSIYYSSSLNSIHFPTASVGYAVGNSGTILKTSDGGQSWNAQISGNTTTWYGVHFTDATTGYAAGATGKIYKTTDGGAVWTAQSSGTTTDIKGIHFSDANNGIAVAGSEALVTSDGGEEWLTYDFPGESPSVNSVHCINTTTAVAAGAFGEIYKLTESGWVYKTSGVSVTLTDVHFPAGSNTGYAVGASGTIVKTTNAGETWTVLNSGTTVTLNQVYFLNDNVGFILGASGVVRKTIDGGQNWTVETVMSSPQYLSMHFTDNSTGYLTSSQGHILKTFIITPQVTINTPTVATNYPSSISATSANLGGDVTADGGAPVTEYGVVYNTTGNPTTADTKVSMGSGNGDYSQSVTGLSGGTVYYVKAYAINSQGTSYGDMQSFTTTSATVTSIKRKTPEKAITNATSVTFEIIMGSAVTGLTESHLELTTTDISGTSITNLSGSGTTWNVTVNTGSGDGTIRLDMKNAVGITPVTVVEELASTEPFPFAAPTFPYTSGEVYTIDKTKPTTTISSTVTGPTTTSPIPMKVDFSEDVTGFDLTDIAVNGATKGNFQGSGKAYTFDLTPSANGAVTVNVNTEVALDEAGNDNKEATQFEITYSGASSITVTSIKRQSPTSSITNASSVHFEITMGSAVTGLSASNLALTTSGVSGASITNVTGSGTTWTATVNTGTGDGTIRLDMNNASGVEEEPSGGEIPGEQEPTPIETGSDESEGFAILGALVSTDETTPPTSAFPYTLGEAYTIDKTAPTTTISSTATGPTNTSPITVKIEFSEDVTGFDINDVTVSGGTKGTLSGSGKTYTFDLTPSGNGTITVDVAAEVAMDEAGNDNSVATQFSIEYSATPTTNITVTSINRKTPSNALTNASSVVFELIMGVNVTGLSASNLSLTTSGVSGASITNVSGSGATYSVTVNTGSGDGTIRLDMDNATGITEEVVIVQPPVIIPPVIIPPVVWPPIIWPPIPFPLATASFPYTSGEVYTIDKTAPTVIISSIANNPTDVIVIPVTIEFSEDVTGFDIDDIIVSGGTKDNFSGRGKNYTVDVTASQAGTVTVDVNTEVASDEAGNENISADQFSIQYQVYNNPVITVTSIKRKNPAVALTNTSSVDFEITMGSAVVGLSTSNLSLTTTGVSDASITNLSGNGAIYIVTVNTGSGDGTIRLDIANVNGVAKLVEVGGASPEIPLPLAMPVFPYTSGQVYTIDKTSPVPTISSTANSPSEVNPIPVKIEFSENVSGFDIDDITVSGGTKGVLSGSGLVFTLDVTPTAEGTVTIDVAADVAKDEAGNNNSAASQFSYVYDICGPIQIEFQPNNAHICKGKNAGFSIMALGDDLTYEWQADKGQGFINIEDGETYTGSKTFNLKVINPVSSFEAYKFRAIVTSRCSEVISETVQITFQQITPPVGNLASRVGPGSVTLTASGTSEGHYKWYTEDGSLIESETNSTYTTPELDITTTYYVAISTGKCESDKTPVVAEINPIPVPPVIIANQVFSIEENSAKGTIVGTVQATDADGTTFNSWTIISGNANNVFNLNPITGVISVNNQEKLDFETAPLFTLTLTVSDGVNTSVEQTITINVTDLPETGPEIFIPTAFSPNGDGVNDTWELKDLGFYTNSVVKIFNTDGHEVFSNKGYTAQWDGKYKGKDMSLGTYYYIIKLNDASKKIYKGNLMIID